MLTYYNLFFIIFIIIKN